MSTSQTQICNQALQLVGSRSQIESITEGSPEANALLVQWDNVRDQLLRAAHWGFAGKTLTASLLKAAPGTPENPTNAPAVWSSADPPPNWLYEYSYPSDCLLLKTVTPQSNNYYASPVYPLPYFSYLPPMPGPVKFLKAMDTINGSQQSVILTNARQAIFAYTAQVDNPNVWDGMFQSAMAGALAGAVAFQLTGNPKLSELLYQKANAVIMQARAQDGNEGLTTQDAPGTWIAARDTYGYYFPGPFNVGYWGNYGPTF